MPERRRTRRDPWRCRGGAAVTGTRTGGPAGGWRRARRTQFAPRSVAGAAFGAAAPGAWDRSPPGTRSPALLTAPGCGCRSPLIATGFWLRTGRWFCGVRWSGQRSPEGLVGVPWRRDDRRTRMLSGSVTARTHAMRDSLTAPCGAVTAVCLGGAPSGTERGAVTTGRRSSGALAGRKSRRKTRILARLGARAPARAGALCPIRVGGALRGAQRRCDGATASGPDPARGFGGWRRRRRGGEAGGWACCQGSAPGQRVDLAAHVA